MSRLPTASDLTRARRPAVFIANGFGDHVLALPALRALQTLYPDRLQLITQPRCYPAFYRTMSWRSVLEIDVSVLSYREGRYFDIDTVVGALESCDAFFSLNTWHNPHVDRLLSRPGFPPSMGYSRAFTHPIEIEYVHAMDRAFALPARLRPTLDLEPFSGPVQVAESVLEQAWTILRLLPDNARLLVVHNETEARKCYPSDRFREVLVEFLAAHPDFVALSVGFDEQGLEGTDGARILEVPSLSLGIATALVQAADLFLGVDSVFLHVADLARVPSVGLFGPTEPSTWGFRLSSGTALGGDGQPMEGIANSAVVEALAAHTSGTTGKERPRRLAAR